MNDVRAQLDYQSAQDLRIIPLLDYLLLFSLIPKMLCAAEFPL